MKSAVALVAFVALAAMAFDIPTPYFWNYNFAVHYGDLDEQHVVLFTALRELCDHKAEEPRLVHLRNVIEDHFRYEEGRMNAVNYEHVEEHVGIHHAFEATLTAASSPVTDDNCSTAKQWLVDHITTIDFKYKTHL